MTDTGERLPLLIDRSTGVPLFDATVYALTEVRARNRAANTIQQHLVAIGCLLLFCRAAGIEINERIRSGELLTVGELDGLTRAVRLPFESLVAQVEQLAMPKESQRWRHKIIPLEAHRQAFRTKGASNVDSATAANRLRVISAYLGWLTLLGPLP